MLDTTTPFTNDTLWAFVSGTTDADGDTIFVKFDWYRNGDLIQSTTKEAIAGGSYETLALYLANYGNKGDAISCKVTPWDAYDTGTPTTLFATVANSAPVIETSNLSSLQSFTGDAVELQIQATDADGDTITYTLTGNLPPGLSLSSTGLITGTISPSANTTTPYSATVTASDGTLSDTTTFDWTIAQPTITLDNPGNQTHYHNVPLAFGLTASNSAGHPLTYSISSATPLPDGLQIHADYGSIWGIMPITAVSATPYTVTVIATDIAAGVSASQTFTFTVLNHAPVIGSVTFDNSAPKTNDVLTAFVDASDADYDALSYTYVWTVGGVVVQTTPTTSTTDSLDLSQPGYGDKDQVVEVSVTASDAYEAGTAVSAAVTVANTAPTIAGLTFDHAAPQTNDLLTAEVNGANDADGDAISYTYVWSVNTFNVETHTTTNSTDVFDLSLTGNGDVGDGITVSVTASDGSLDEATASISTTVEAPPAIGNAVMVVYSGDGYQGTRDGEFLLYRSDATGTLTVNYFLIQRASEENATVTETSGQATFADGSYSTEVIIASSGVSSGGADVNYTLEIVANEGAGYEVGGLSVQSLTIHALAKVWIDSVQYAVEGESAGYFRLKRTSTAGEMTVTYVLDSGSDSAVAGVDFAPLPGSVTFADGQEYADIVIDPTGVYDANNLVDKTVVIQLTNLAATALPPGPGPVVIVAPAAPAPAAPVFVTPGTTTAVLSYTFYAGEGAPGVNQDTANPSHWIGQVSATNAVTYGITGGNAAGYFQIKNTGWISPALRLPLVNTTYNLTVTATNRGVTTNIPVTIHLRPWVYLTGDLQGVKSDLGIECLGQDIIRLDYVRIASAAELAAELTVSYAVTWDTTDRDRDLINAADLVAVGATNRNLTFAAGRGVSSIELTPRQVALSTPMVTFKVSLQDSLTSAYKVSYEYDKLDELRNWGQREVTCTIFPRTTLFASSNTNPTFQDAAADLGVHFNDIKQGWIGDCFLMADLMALAKSNPAAIRNMIADLGDGMYRVTFYNYGNLAAETVDVTLELTYGISQANFLGDYIDTLGVRSYEIWPQIIEKAYSAWFGRRRFVNGWVDFTENLEIWPDLRTVGGACATMTRLTGQRASETDMRALNAAAQNAFLAALILDFTTNNKPVVLVDVSHSYAVTDYNATTNQFWLRDPLDSTPFPVARALLIGLYPWAIRLP